MSDPEPMPPASAWVIQPDELHIEDDAQIGGRQIAQGCWRNSLVVVKIQAEPTHGVVHGSLKPMNILIWEDGMACVSDYEMIELQTSRGSGHRYFSPEAWKGVRSTLD
ncbi:Protein kinase domain-containing protein [Mycena venus]|uniref:Protein kinase domain-containing protein n=1 Tax=Mycena venus TaxID=2733690 RepID=A0A8H7CGK8_9AGAR|nr:Protein kinase domain-containing protein [Mycena venus]